MHFGVLALLLVVFMLSFAAFQGVWKFRILARNIKVKSVELPLAADLNLKISELRSVLWQDNLQISRSLVFDGSDPPVPTIPEDFSVKHAAVEESLERYYQQLVQTHTSDHYEQSDLPDGQSPKEIQFVDEFRHSLEKIKRDHEQGERIMSNGRLQLISSLRDDLEQLQHDAAQLPLFTEERMMAFANQARSQYHTANVLCLVFTATTMIVIGILVTHFRRRIFVPLQTLLEGSRQVAAGNYRHRIRLDTDDEVSELADALNAMTQNFQQIKKNLNIKVRERTREVIRSEKMASVGFLAAGIAHEINNPLASIAWSAESLEMRIEDILGSQDEEISSYRVVHEAEAKIAGDVREESQSAVRSEQGLSNPDILQMKKYLAMIQEEAFRCKEITAGLLDFSRMGDARKVPTNISQVISTVVDMLKPLSKYRGKNIHFDADFSIIAPANSQELKQVALNLITNALSSVEVGGNVEIRLFLENGNVVFQVADDGCGMDDEVKQHLFEPFYTRRRDGQGTGLGLSISYQIIQDHGGDIVPFSAGPGKGSSFVVRLPMNPAMERKHAEKSAA